MRGVKSRLEKLERRSGKPTSIVVVHSYIEPGLELSENIREHQAQPEDDADVPVIHSAIPPRDSEAQ